MRIITPRGALCAAALVFAAGVAAAGARAGEVTDPSAPHRPGTPLSGAAGDVRLLSAAPVRPELLREGLVPGMVLREWRVVDGADAAPGVVLIGLPAAHPGPDGFPAPEGPAGPEPHAWPAADAPGSPAAPDAGSPESGVEPPRGAGLTPYFAPGEPAPPPGGFTRRAGTAWDSSPVRNGDCSPVCAQRRDECCWPLDCNGRRYGRFDLRAELALAAINDPEEVLGEPIFGPLAASQFDWDALEYGLELGFRLSAAYAVAPQKRLAARFQWFGPMDDGSAQSGGRFAFEPGPDGTGGVSDPVDGVLDLETRLWTGELNYVSEFSCSGCWRWDLLAGLRVLSLEDDARVDFSPNAGIDDFTGPAFIVSETENLFVGVQIGVAAAWDVSPSFVLTGSLKGLAGNVSREARVSDQSIFVGGPHASGSEEDEFVLGAEAELGLLWRVTPRLGVTATYTLLLLDGVLRGYDAMDFTHSTSGAVQARQRTDQLVAHSLFLGLELNL